MKDRVARCTGPCPTTIVRLRLEQASFHPGRLTELMDVPTRAKLAVRRSPALWMSYVALRFPSQPYKATQDAICSPNHEVLLDGYPRSANSYVFNFLTHFHEDLRCVHHSHASATLKMANRFGVPSFVLIRDPLDAVVSNVIRSGGNLAYHEAHYEQYYGYVAENLEAVTLIPFASATKDPVTVLRLVEDELGLPRSDPTRQEVRMANERIEDHLEHIAREKYGEDAGDKKAVPDERRDRQKAHLKEELEETDTIHRLRQLHRRALQQAPRA